MGAYLNYKLFVATVACLFAAAFFADRSFEKLPAKSELRTVEGVVDRIRNPTRTSRLFAASTTMVILQGKSVGYQYLSWFPNPISFSTYLSTGDRVQILCDRQQKPWIWGLRKEGIDLVTYDQILNVVRTDRQLDPYLAIGLGLLGLYLAFRITKALIAIG